MVLLLLSTLLLLAYSGGSARASEDGLAHVGEDGSVEVEGRGEGAPPMQSRRRRAASGPPPAARRPGAAGGQAQPAALGRPLSGSGSAAAAPPEYLLPPGRVFAFHASCRPNSFALVPSRSAFVVTDGAVHGDKYAIPQVQDKMGWVEWAMWRSGLGAAGPYPFAYLISADGELLRTLEFVDRDALARGAAESLDAHLAFTFYQGPGLEVWDDTLDMKMTYHELGSKPSQPVFDTDGVLWLPYTVADRLGEEGEHAPVVWAYKRDGTMFEVFHRRQLGIAYPAALHFDASGRMALAGLSEWVFNDGMYGQELAVEERDDFAPGTAPCRLELYTVSGDRARSEFGAEQRARWMASTESSPAPGQAEATQPLTAVPLLEATYDFPFPTCLHALFALTGDGHVITACRGSSSLRIVRIGYPVGLRSAAPRELARAAAAAESLPGRKQLREAWAPPLAPTGAAAIRLLPSNASHLRADIVAPWGVKDIGGLAMDPSGRSFALLDSGSAPARLLVLPWPWEDLQNEESLGGSSSDVGEVPIDTRMVLTVAPDMPQGLLTEIVEPPRSS